MPDVVVSWFGRCQEKKIQEELCLKMDEIGELSNRLINDYFGLDVDTTRYHRESIADRVFLSSRLCDEYKISGGFERVNKDFLSAMQFGLFGIEFHLFDPRLLNSPFTLMSEDMMSFLFIHSPNHELNGCMVRVQSWDDVWLGSKELPERKEGELLLSIPQLDFRYYLQGWITRLLGWVKRFYVPDLRYWKYEYNPGFDVYEEINPDDKQKREAIFAELKDEFLEEAETWKAIVDDMERERRSDPIEINFDELEDPFKPKQFKQRGKNNANGEN